MDRWDENPSSGSRHAGACHAAEGKGTPPSAFNASSRFYRYADRFPVMKLMDSISVSAMVMVQTGPAVDLSKGAGGAGPLSPEACLFV